jgi:hypothetical protein
MPHDSENYMTRRATGVALITLGILLCAVVIVVLRVQWNSPLTRWLAAIADLLMSFGVDMDVRVLSLCACATLISGLLFLTSDSSKAAIIGWQLARFVLHLVAVYAIAGYGPRLAGWTRNVVLPLIQVPTSSSSFEFVFSHIFAFSFVPALFAGLTNASFKHKAAQYVWLVPAIVLAYKFATFPTPMRSVLDNAPSFPNFSGAFHEYFGRDFLIGEYRDWGEFWRMVSGNPDMIRGMTQLRVTAPFYAGIGYCLAACVALRFRVHQKFVEHLKAWEQSRLDPY